MKGKLTLVLALAISSPLFAQSGASPASTAASATGATKIGVINIQAAILNTNEGKRDFEALDKKFEPKRVELKSASDEIESLKKQLQAQGEHLNDEERNRRVSSIESKSKLLQRNVDDATTELQGQQGELANRIGGKMMEVIDKYARANGIGLVLDVSGQASPVLWANETVNITEGVITAYNAASNVAAPPATAGGATTPRTGTTGTTSRPVGGATPGTSTPKKPAGTEPR